MREAFRALVNQLRKHRVEPGGVELVIRFHDSRDRDKIAFAIGKEFAALQDLSGTPDHIYRGGFYGIGFELKAPD